MRIFLTIEVLALFIVIVSEWRYWSKTWNWRPTDTGFQYQTTMGSKRTRMMVVYDSLALSIAGFFFIIWS